MPNYLTEIRDEYAGPWPRALRAVATIAIGGHLVAHFIFGAPLWSVGVLGSLSVGVALVVFALWMKRRYPASKTRL
jgi:hypothetical protein